MPLIIKIVQRTDVSKMAEEVNEDLANGWKIRNKMYISSHFNQNCWYNQYTQVLIKAVSQEETKP